MVGDGSTPQVSFITLSDANIEINVSVFRFEFKGSLVGVQCGFVMSIGIMSQAEVTIGRSVRGIHAERGSSFGKRIVGVPGAIKDVGKLTMRFRKGWLEAQRFAKHIDCFVKTFLPLQDRTQDKQQ